MVLFNLLQSFSPWVLCGKEYQFPLPHHSVSPSHPFSPLGHKGKRSFLAASYLFLFVPLGVPFPKNFLQICKKILCRLFRVFVHVYIHHFDRVIVMGAEAHVNTCYKHFYYFVTEMNLIDRKELEPLVSVSAVRHHTLRELRKAGVAFDQQRTRVHQNVYCNQITVLSCSPGGEIMW